MEQVDDRIKKPELSWIQKMAMKLDMDSNVLIIFIVLMVLIVILILICCICCCNCFMEEGEVPEKQQPMMEEKDKKD